MAYPIFQSQLAAEMSKSTKLPVCLNAPRSLLRDLLLKANEKSIENQQQ